MDLDRPHVVILPFPAQGHIKPMLILAELLSEAGFTISFVNSEHNHRRLLSQIDQASFRRRREINFLSIPDGLPPEHPRSGLSVIDLFFSTSTLSKPFFRNLIASMSQPPTCIISDGIMSFAIDVAEELEIPVITFRTFSAACTWICFHLENLIRHRDIPVLQGNEDMDNLISFKIPGLETILRRRDLPSICRLDPENPIVQFYNSQSSKMTKAFGLILNTFEELESPVISHLRSIFPAVYAIGPLHWAHKHTTTLDSSSGNLMSMDKSYMDWLDSQQPNSVLYVSFGSVIVLSPDELMEFYHGLVNSGKMFLWSMRPELIRDDNGTSKLPEELMMAIGERGRIVGWVPQEDVLCHDAVGGFLTHSGWNSTLESIAAGKPMICWPKVADQQVNSRCVSTIWKVGLDMKDICNRSMVEKMVRDLMEGSRREQIMKSMDELSRMALNCILDNGSSNSNIKKLIEDIKLLHSKKKLGGNDQD